MFNFPQHKFHIPVMGLGFSIDTPIKVAHYGIDSVISIVDDDLIEKMRRVHCANSGFDYAEIPAGDEDYRARRITAYLNLVNEIVTNNFNMLKLSFGEKDGEFEKYISLLPDDSQLKLYYTQGLKENNLSGIKSNILSGLQPGSIDVNIMTKLDRVNYVKNEKLPVKYNDAHAALRGYAMSDLSSSIVLSAGMNPRLYSYFEDFPDFYPDPDGKLRKKIILKVSDYRSALIQGKFLAKKGLWVSEYRIESGLNCGGHAFATDGFLMGPILEEFKTNRVSLIDTMQGIYTEALRRKKIEAPLNPLELKITAQGGVGTFEEQKFLIEHYQVDSVGWGTPFLLVPEVTNVDRETLNLLCNAAEDDLYLSKISPLGVPFNSLRGNSKDMEKLAKAMEGRPGSPCPKKYLQFDTEFGDKPICTASRTYQSKKIEQLRNSYPNHTESSIEYEKIIDKSCLCVGLATSVLKNNNANTKSDGENVLICPGPNLAYFSSIVTLKEMADHIYGRINIIKRNDRPNMFLKELKLYLDYLEDKVEELKENVTSGLMKYFDLFQFNIAEGIEYYKRLFSSMPGKIININRSELNDLTDLENKFNEIRLKMISLDLLPLNNADFRDPLAAANYS